MTYCNVVFGSLLDDELNVLFIVLVLDDIDEDTASARARLYDGYDVAGAWRSRRSRGRERSHHLFSYFVTLLAEALETPRS